MKKKPLLFIALALVVAAAIVGAVVIALDSQKSFDEQKPGNKSNTSANQNKDEIPNDKKAAKPAETNSVNIKNFTYNPGAIEVKVGTTVTWTNKDRIAHTVTSDESSVVKFNSGDMAEGKSFSMKFTKAGVYNYHCAHHQYMHGTIVVTE